MAMIAKSKRTFHQEHQGSYIQCNGNNNLKHGSNHLTAAKLILVCAKTLLKLKIPRKISKFASDMKKKRTNPYKEANEAFLAEKAKEKEMDHIEDTTAVCIMEKWIEGS